MVKDLLIILISSSLVSNVVLSQFLGLCPFLGVSKKTGTAAGMGTAVIFVITLASAVAGAIYKFILLPSDDRVYFSDRGIGAVCGNVFKEVHEAFIPGAWCLSSPYHDQLCRAWGCAYQRSEKLRNPDRDRKRVCHGGRVYHFHSDTCRYP